MRLRALAVLLLAVSTAAVTAIALFLPEPPEARPSSAVVPVPVAGSPDRAAGTTGAAGTTETGGGAPTVKTWVDLAQAQLPVRFLGQVRDKRGPVAGADVRVHPESFRTDAEGRFEMRTPHPLSGPISVQVRRGEIETWYSLPGMAPGTTTYERELVLGDEEIRVATIDASGEPAPARLTIAAEAVRGPIEVETVRFDPVFVDESGERALRGLLPGTYAVRARFDDGSEAEGVVAPPESARLELRTPPSGSLEVRVIDREGRPVAGLWVSIEREDGVRWGETDVEGRATFRGVDVGASAVRVRPSRRAWTALDDVIAEHALELAAGEARAIELTVRER